MRYNKQNGKNKPGEQLLDELQKIKLENETLMKELEKDKTDL